MEEEQQHHHHHHHEHEHEQQHSEQQHEHHHSEHHHEHHHNEHHSEHHHSDGYADNSQHRRHRHIDTSIDTDESFISNFKKWTETYNKNSKVSKRDITSKFRNIMRERYLRKRLYRKLVWYIGIFLIVILTLSFLFAYCFDIQEEEMLY